MAGFTIIGSGLGADIEDRAQIGDFLLLEGTAWTDKMIQFGERLPWRHQKPYAWATHAVLVTSNHGDICEALGRGLTRGHISKYNNYMYVLVRPNLGGGQRSQALAWANYEANRKVKYGFSDIASIIIQMLTPLKFDFNWDGSLICSAYIARYLEHAGVILPTFSPFSTTPADLAKFTGALQP